MDLDSLGGIFMTQMEEAALPLIFLFASLSGYFNFACNCVSLEWVADIDDCSFSLLLSGAKV